MYPKYLDAIRGYEHRSLKPGDTPDIASLHLTVVASDGAASDTALPGTGAAIPECARMALMDKNSGEENARSVGLILSFGRVRIASFGDLTWNVEKAVCPRDKLGPVDLTLNTEADARALNYILRQKNGFSPGCGHLEDR